MSIERELIARADTTDNPSSSSPSDLHSRHVDVMRSVRLTGEEAIDELVNYHFDLLMAEMAGPSNPIRRRSFLYGDYVAAKIAQREIQAIETGEDIPRGKTSEDEIYDLGIDLGIGIVERVVRSRVLTDVLGNCFVVRIAIEDSEHLDWLSASWGNMHSLGNMHSITEGYQYFESRVIEGQSVNGYYGYFDRLFFKFVQELTNRISALYEYMELLITKEPGQLIREYMPFLEEEKPGDVFYRTKQVYAAFLPYAEGKELPAGTTPQIMRFLVVTAAIPGLWGRMDGTDPWLGDALIRYYGDGLSMAKVGSTFRTPTQATQVQRLLNKGLQWLFRELPERSSAFPLDKHEAFDLDGMLSTRNDRRRAASKEWARAHGFDKRGKEFALRRWGLPIDESSE